MMSSWRWMSVSTNRPHSPCPALLTIAPRRTPSHHQAYAPKPPQRGSPGREAIAGRSQESSARRLTCLVLDDPAHVVLGKEPVLLDGEPAGYVTSAAHGYTIGRSIAYAWLPALEVGTAVEIEYFSQRYPATVSAEPLVDPSMSRIRA